MNVQKTIPILRIFDYNKAVAFYVDWLGFKIDWEHRFDADAPRYLQMSFADMAIHLTEHHGDCTPGSKVFVRCTGLRDYHTALLARNYPFNRPGLEDAPWGAWTMEVTDPFGNRLLFNENK